MPKRVAHFIAISSTSGVMVQMVQEPIKDLLGALGITLAASGELPANKTSAGTGKQDALEGGCIAINLVYKKGTDNEAKTQTAKVLCSPTKISSTLFKSLVGLKYSGHNIVKVRVPRRRIYMF